MIGKTVKTPIGIGSVMGVIALAAGATSAPVMAETRGYVVSYIHLATHEDPNNCPDGDNGDFGTIKTNAFKLRGFSQEKIDEVLGGTADFRDMVRIISLRGKKDGKEANVIHYPTTQPNAKLKWVQGDYAYGFDLDGVGAEGDGSFIDPETGQKGVDNKIYRVVGCTRTFDKNLPTRPFFEEQAFTVMAVEMPAWLMSISAEDFSRDGPATLSFHRATASRRTNAVGQSLLDSTYVIDPDPRTHGTFRGEIRNGVFTATTGDTDVLIEGETNFFHQLELAKAQIRIKLNPDRSIGGYMGGYQPWEHYWFAITTGFEDISNMDTAALYQGLMKFADAQPDPETGQNTAISATYRVEGVPAFLALPDGTFITDSNSYHKSHEKAGK